MAETGINRVFITPAYPVHEEPELLRFKPIVLVAKGLRNFSLFPPVLETPSMTRNPI